MEKFTFIIITAIFFICIDNIYSQDQINDILFSSSEKYNKRGEFINDDVRYHDRELISDYDGNLMVKYSMPVSLPNDFGSDFTITYNANVEHRYFIRDDKEGHPVNAPAWILGYKGFALQTLNFETNYRIDHEEPNNYSVYYSGEETPLLIPGYSFTNKLLQGTAVDLYNHNDLIKILMADGSLKTLRNIESFAYTGIYVEVGLENNGFAIVEYYQGTNRRMYLKPGDGLTYYFEEELVKYYDPDNAVGDHRAGPIFERPKIMYLKKVYNNSTATGDNIEFQYQNWIMSAQDPLEYGRKFFVGFHSNREVGDESAEGFLIKYNLSYSNYLDYIKISNLYSDNSLQLNLRYNNLSFDTSRVITKSRMLYIENVVDNLNRKDYFEYLPLGDDKTKRKHKNGANYFSTFEFNLIKRIVYSTGKETEFDYYGRFYGVEPVNYYFDSQLYSQRANENVELAFRDCYTNFMLKSRKTYNKYSGNGTSSILTKTETYDYSRSGNEPMSSPHVDNLFTTITVQDHVGENSSVIIKKTYSLRNTKEVTYHSSRGRIPAIKLVQEEIGGGSTKSVLTNTYDWGTYDDTKFNADEKYYLGTFLINEISNKKYQTVAQTPITAEQKKTYFYTYETLPFTVNNITVQSKSILKSVSVTDAQNFVTYNVYKNFIYGTSSSIPSTFSNMDFFYRIGLIEEEKEYSGTNVKVHKQKTYYDTEEKEFKGKLKTEVFNVSGRSSTDIYDYYTSSENDFYRGFLQTICKNNGTILKFYYPTYIVLPNNKIVRETVSGSVVQNNETKSNATFTHTGFQLLPFKTVIEYNGTSQTRYASYNKLGKLNFEIDINGYYSKYDYDGAGRVKQISFPGSFTNSTGTSSNYSVKYEYDDPNNTITETVRMKTDATLVSRETMYEYDALGKLRKIAVKDDNGTYVNKSLTEYNFLGLKSIEKDGENRTTEYQYDYLSRLTRIKQGGYSKTTQYMLSTDTSYPEYEILTDEENKVKRRYYDKVGLLKKEEADNGTTLTTYYNYNTIKQLSSVTSPMGKITSYSYDDLENISKRVSPDDGGYDYAYDKYGNLRFKLHKTTPPYDLIFTKYDLLNRPVATGKFAANSKAIENAEFDPDLAYETGIASFENLNTDTSKFMLVNMYDSYSPTGVFSGMNFPYSTSLENLKGRLAATAFRDKPGNAWSFKVYTYDHLGNITGYWIKALNVAWIKISNAYDHAGHLVYQHMNSLSASNKHVFWYEYDKQGGLERVRSNSTDNYSTSVIEATYKYNNANQVCTLDVPGSRVLHQYDLFRGWLSKIEEINRRHFSENLLYFNNGNIRQQTIHNYVILNQQQMQSESNITEETIQNEQNLSDQVINTLLTGWDDYTYTFIYDGLNRLKNANCSKASYTQAFDYNNDGGLTIKNRTGENMGYTYGTGINNRLTNLNVNGINYAYSYDNRGNLISDNRKGISIPQYDHRNLPLQLTKSGSSYYYNYDDHGNRLIKKTSSGRSLYILDHLGRELGVYSYNSAPYLLKTVNIHGNGLVGRIEGTSRYYYIKDHLGNIRQTVNNYGTIFEAQDYYPYGSLIREYNSGLAYNRYKFTEKERDSESNHDYFGARYYDNEIGRWLQVDPLADKYPGWSPYNYTVCDPINFYDPNGLEVRGYSERIKAGSNILSRVAVSILRIRHSFLRVSTPIRDVVVELQGPKNNSPFGDPRNSQSGSEYKNGRDGVEEFKVIRPNGISENDYSFENKIMELFDIITQKNILPFYNMYGPNSNGFIKWLVEKAGGKLELPSNAYGADTKAYEEAYQQYVNQRQQDQASLFRTNQVKSDRFREYYYNPFE